MMTTLYTADWPSLIGYPVPEWMIDAKFGLYAHWGLYAVPGFGNEWYGKRVYEPDNPVHAEHVNRFGPLNRFGYKDFIPQFMAEQYDPDAWAELFQASGARYGGFSLAHHDGYGLWDSDLYPWNVGKMGPKRDLYGEFVAALRRRNLRIVAPFHIVRGYNWFLPGWDQYTREVDQAAVDQGKAEGWDLFDPAYADFYWNSEVGADYDQFLDLWKAKIIEVVDRYQPDLMWFDGGEFRDSPYEHHTLELLAHYFNRSVEWNKEVCVLNKLPTNLKYNFPPEFGVLNFEAGRSRDSALARPWNDDLKIGDRSWGYVEGQQYLSGRDILNNLIDRVSRGGSLMLSLSPKADGAIPDGQQQALREVGAWLQAYGEAIYDTRAWTVHGEGDDERLMDRSGRLPKWDLAACTADDKRYSQSKDGRFLYAMTLGKPDGPVLFGALGQAAGLLTAPIRRVDLLGGGPAAWQQQDAGLAIDLAGVTLPSEAAAVWRIELDRAVM